MTGEMSFLKNEMIKGINCLVSFLLEQVVVR